MIPQDPKDPGARPRSYVIPAVDPLEFSPLNTNTMSAGDVGLIITAVALLLCLRCRRTKPAGSLTDDDLIALIEIWRRGQ